MERTLVAESLDKALKARSDLDKYGSAKRALFALQLFFNIEDITSIASDIVTDGSDDKSVDFVYVDRDNGRIIIGQSYESTRAKRQVKGTKAASLHQAVNWLLGGEEKVVPDRLKGAYREIHEALEDGAIADAEIWFVHNLGESKQVQDELDQAASAAHQHVMGRYNGLSINARGLEIGKATLNEVYEGSLSPILVSEEYAFDTGEFFMESGDNWKAVCVSIPATWLHDQYSLHKEKIFSANIRGYLGSARSKGNINNGIKDTATKRPMKFWAFNNGITALVHSFDVDRDAGKLIIRGIAIVNGAQTTGSIGSVDRETVEGGRVLARFIDCSDANTVREIIRYNNRQNPTQAADFRSNDPIQTRLVKEFESMKIVGYNGGRRGGAEDVIRRPADNQISAPVAAQALAAFHGEPATAYHEKGQIWESNDLYTRYFSDRTTAAHIHFVYSLLKAIESLKADIVERAEKEKLQSDVELAEFFKLRGSSFVVMSAVAQCIEVYLGTHVSDKFRLRFKKTSTVAEGAKKWETLLVPLLALAPSALKPALDATRGLSRRGSVEQAVGTFRSLLQSTVNHNKSIYQAFASEVTVDRQSKIAR